MIQIGGGNGGAQFQPSLLLHLAECLHEDALDGRWITPQVLEGVAEFENVPLAACYAATLFAPDLEFQAECDIQFEICMAGCVQKNAAGLLTQLLSISQGRISSGKTSFDVVPRGCLDACDFGPILRTRSDAGTFVHTNIQPEGVSAIVTAVCD